MYFKVQIFIFLKGYTAIFLFSACNCYSKTTENPHVLELSAVITSCVPFSPARNNTA